MKDFFRNAVAIAILLLFAFVVYYEMFAPSSAADGSMNKTSLSFADSQQMYQDLGGSLTDVPVTVFVTSWCSVCKALEKTLQKGKVPFVRADIESSRDALLYYKRATRNQTSAVPVTVVGDKVFLGYNMQAIFSSILSQKKRLTSS